MISYDCQMQGLSCDARRIREPGRQVNSLLRPWPPKRQQLAAVVETADWVVGERPREPRLFDIELTGKSALPLLICGSALLRRLVSAANPTRLRTNQPIIGTGSLCAGLTLRVHP